MIKQKYLFQQSDQSISNLYNCKQTYRHSSINLIKNFDRNNILNLYVNIYTYIYYQPDDGTNFVKQSRQIPLE